MGRTVSARVEALGPGPIAGLARRRFGSLAAVVAIGLGPVALSPPVAAAAEAPPDERPRAVFALILGVNASPGTEVAPLRYADDDAARYLDLFRALGARAQVLARLDANTRGLHPQAAAEALPPRRDELRKAVQSLARDIQQSRARGVPSTLYLVYAGHGRVEDQTWYLTLEDGRLSGEQLISEVVERAGADRSHVIIDACHAYLLALPRGPGGMRRPLDGFVELEAASRAGRIGYLLSSSTSGESHEWAGFEAGVFSHEVRSGLYGAADADGDGRVSYTEIGAFVARANEAIASERFRPRVLARPARGDDLLLDLRARRQHTLRLEGPEGAAHHLLETGSGIRLLDFHTDGRTPVVLVRPPGEGLLYLRRVGDGFERTVPRADGVVQLAGLPLAPARAQDRGAAHQAFSRIFSLAFDAGAVQTFARRTAEDSALIEAARRSRERESRRLLRRRIGGAVALGVATASSVAAVAVARSAHALLDAASATESHRDVFRRNQRIAARNRGAAALALGAVAAGAGSLWLLLWPAGAGDPPGVDVALTNGGAALGAGWRF
jgi:hypothetical protein